MHHAQMHARACMQLRLRMLRAAAACMGNMIVEHACVMKPCMHACMRISDVFSGPWIGARRPGALNRIAYNAFGLSDRGQGPHTLVSGLMVCEPLVCGPLR